MKISRGSILVVAALTLALSVPVNAQGPSSPIRFAESTSASGSSGQLYSGNDVTIDAGELASGRIKVKYSGNSSKRLKARITCPNGTNYDYNVNTAGNEEIFPLSEGNGDYTIAVLQNVVDSKYAVLLSQKVSVTLNDAFSPFLLSNQFVSYTADSKVVAKGAELVKGKTTTIDKVSAVYNYVVKNFTYDTQKASSVQSGYLPAVDAVLESKKGICFDYAAVMAAMLRSNQIPTKMVVGYSGKVYHAWLDVYTPEKGWVNEVIFFDGTSWKLMDPTFASGSASSKEIMKYIGNNANYQAKYVY